MRPTRVLHIIEQLGVGGAEKQLLGLLRRIDTAKCEQSVIYFRDSADSLRADFDEVARSVVHVDKDALPAPIFIARLRASIRQIRPDAVHTWLTCANLWGRWAAVVAGVDHVFASDRAELTAGSFALRVSEWMLQRRTVRLANSRAVARSLHMYGGLPMDAITVMPNAVELPFCDREAARARVRQDLDLPSDHRLVVMIARQAPEKNYPMFLEVGRIVCAHLPDVTFLGIGRQHNKVEIEALGQLGVGTRVRLLDSQPDIPRWLAAADVMCLTSNYEGLPNAVLEGMAAGLPIVCTSFASAEEVLGSHCGMLVPRNDAAAMAQRIEMLLADTRLAAGLGAAAQRRAQEVFSWDTLVAQMERMYESVRLPRVVRDGVELRPVS